MTLRPFLLPAFLLLVASGCLEPAVRGTGDDGAEDPPFARDPPRIFTVIDPAGGTGEPSFGSAPDGTLFANGRGGRGGAVYRSNDDGLSWTNVGSPVDPAPNFDPDLAVDKDGTVWFSALWIGCTSVGVSRDGGETWTSNNAACNTVAADRQYVVPTEGGTAYLYSHQLPTFWQMAAKTTDYGRTWVPTSPIEPPAENNPTGRGSGWGGGGFWNEATGSVFLTWTWNADSESFPGFAVTRDGGASWQLGDIKGHGGERLGLGLVVGAADTAGNVYVAWGETYEEGTAIYVAGSQDDGRTWTVGRRVDERPGSKVFPAIAAGKTGQVAVAYYESAEAAHPSDVQAEWNVTLSYSMDFWSPEPRFWDLPLSQGSVKKGPICISGTTCETTGNREFADYFQAHTLPDGRVGAIYNSLLAVPDTTVEIYAATNDAIFG